jgi:hypothetical protein
VLSMLENPKAYAASISPATEPANAVGASNGNTMVAAASAAAAASGVDFSPTPEELQELVVDEIAGVLWRLVYQKPENMDPQVITEFAKYVYERILIATRSLDVHFFIFCFYLFKQFQICAPRTTDSHGAAKRRNIQWPRALGPSASLEAR